MNSEELHKFKFTLEDKWKKRFDKLQQQTQAAKSATARDVKQLTMLHQNHVKALEKSLREETTRLEKVRRCATTLSEETNVIRLRPRDKTAANVGS